MNGINEVNLIGNLVRDTEIKETKNGKTMAVNVIAVESGEMSAFISLVAYSKTAEFMEKVCKKGRRVFVNGSLSTYKDANGNYTTNVIVRSFETLTKKDSVEPVEATDESDLPF